MENVLARREYINISFKNLSYKIPVGHHETVILKNLNGNFKSGNISAILGPSGGGKTTVLNILSGFTTMGVSGTVCINGKQRNLDKFYKISRYIRNENSLTTSLTIYECMYFASRFKLGNRISSNESKKMIEESLNTLRLTGCKNTLTDDLSGGEKKRLAIGLELIGCPSILFLDEPTTGLDEQSSFECISLFKKMADEGMTIILSIHSPSAKVLEQLHQLYVIAEGKCIYNGHGSELIPFFNKIRLPCPIYCNPVDFLMELAAGDFGKNIDELAELADITISEDTHTPFEEQIYINKTHNEANCSFWKQFSTLMYRSYLQERNNKMNLLIRMLSLISVTLLIGIIGYKCGNDGSKITSNIFFVIMTNFKAVYFIIMPVLFNCSTQINQIQFEQFNKWYDVLPFFLVQQVQMLLLIIIYAAIYVTIVFPLTDQPLEILRILKFAFIYILVCLITEAHSEIIGVLFNPVNALFVGVTAIFPCAVFSFQAFGHGIELLPQLSQYLTRISFIRLGIEGILHSLYNNRGRIYCPEEEFCPFSTPKQVMKRFGYEHSSYISSVLGLIVWLVIMKVIAFFVLKERIKPNVVTHKFYTIKNYIIEIFSD